MTAEIAVMNKMGVALAADSAISIPTAGNTKVYHSNKLFMLSKYEPVGVMVYGNAELMSVPWESIIKTYRQELKETSFKKLEDYATNFLTFLNSNALLFPPDEQEHYVYGVTFSFFNEVKDGIDKAVEKIAHQARKVSLTDIKVTVRNHIDAARKFVDDLPRLDTLPKEFEREVLTKYIKIIDQAIDDVFQKLPLSTQGRKELRRISVGLFARDTFLFGNVSGVVIAGFGKDDVYPVLVAYEVEGVVNDKLKSKQTEITGRVTSHNDAALFPFAQREMVVSFMEGVAPSYRETLENYLDTLFEKYPKHIMKHLPVKSSKVVKSQLVDKLKEEGKTLVADFWTNVDAWTTDYNVLPVLKTIGVLPLDELASMAESLVNLTSFKRRVTLVPETVGGPIDVAVISKGDGFIWIKRTRYFEAENNPHFQSGYYR